MPSRSVAMLPSSGVLCGGCFGASSVEAPNLTIIHYVGCRHAGIPRHVDYSDKGMWAPVITYD